MTGSDLLAGGGFSASEINDVRLSLLRLGSLARFENVGDLISQELCELFDAFATFAMRFEKGTQSLVLVGAYPSGAAAPTFEIELGEGLLGHIVKEGISELYENDYEKSRYRLRSTKDVYGSSLAGVMYSAKGDVVGGVTIARKAGSAPFSKTDLLKLRLFLDFAAQTFDGVLLREKVERLREQRDKGERKLARLLLDSQSALYDKADELEALVKRSSEAVSLERLRISQALHDSTKQELSGIIHIVEAAIASLPEDAAKSRELLHRALEFLCDADTGIRQIIADLQPVNMSKVGLVEAINRYCVSFSSMTGTQCSFEASGEEALPRKVEEALYYFTVEALQNVAVHSGASAASVTLSMSPLAARVSVGDNGRGFDPAGPGRNAGGGLGIPGMKRRIEALGGEVFVKSAKGEGVVVSARIPLSSASLESSGEHE